MKVLQINCVYGKGSTGKITRDIHRGLLEAGHESIVIYGRGPKTTDPGTIKRCPEWYAKFHNLRSRIDGIMYGGCFFSTNAILARIKKEKPDVVHLQCINGYFVNIFRLLEFLKRNRIPTVLTLHAEFMYTANCGYAGTCNQWMEGCSRCPRLRKQTKSLVFDRTGAAWNRMHAIYRDWEGLTIVGCSDWISGRARHAGALRDSRVMTLRNGVDNTSVFYPRPDAGKRLREAYHIGPDKKIVLYVAPAFTELKGFDLALELARRCQDLPLHFLMVGQEQTLPNENITVVGPVSDGDRLAELYAGADVLLMCSRFENYPTVCLEAISCGTPVAAYVTGGVAETIPAGMGGTVPHGDPDAMAALLMRLAARRPDGQTVRNARYIHSKERMVADYLKLYQSLLDKQ